ncbi:MAG: zinc-ribbon and DUF3426 domain-containing protein [Alcanivorax sediminis]|uniref:zinc-ribbon and DUF3426 domain-containing protein n=1 Tax=Alcanivorax sediminis TaxID=2663008 RepID=UPI003C3E168D
MATQYKTRCPHCAAQFKITEEHLKQANGAVRCGSCLQIFQATDHLVDPPSNDKSASEDRWAGALDTSSATPPPPREKTPPPEEDLIKSPDGLSMEGMELSDSFMSLEEGSDEDGLGEDFSDMAGAGRSTHNEGADESWAEALLNELEDDDEPVSAQPKSPPPATFAPRDEQPRQTPPSAARPSGGQATPATRKPQQKERKEDDSLFGGLDLFGDDLNDEPVAIPSRPVRERDLPFKPRYDWQGLIKWTALSLLAAVVLVGQYAYFNFDHLARTPQWRPVYLQACDALGCRLPSRSDISKLRGANLVVRSHPEYNNALIVDAILYNEARYPQPFPDLELRFSALDGSPVASRRFKPEEYLHGDLRGMDNMPTKTPLHVSLEIVDPGNKAVNYNLRLLPSLKNASQVSQR